ncbi:MAG: hypothetical protein WC465_03825 [Patescibacteria group bacterium]
MLVKNLLLTFDHQADGQIFFRTDNGATISLPDFLFSASLEPEQKIYLSADLIPMVNIEENKKQLLNELLGGNDDKS